MKDNTYKTTYRTITSKDQLLDVLVDSFLAIMDREGSGLNINCKELYQAAGVPHANFYNNFGSLDGLMECIQKRLINQVNYKLKSFREPLSDKNALFWTLKSLTEHKNWTEFAIRRFDIDFWALALEPLIPSIMQPWNHYPKETVDRLFSLFVGVMMVHLREWWKEGFPIERMDAYISFILDYRSYLDRLAPYLRSK